MARGKKKQPIQINNVAEKMKAEGYCRLCERKHKDIGPRELTRHRLVPGRHGGEYIVANVIPLCRYCHDVVEAQNPEARMRLRPKLWPMEVAHAIKKMSEQWFDLMYPKPAFPKVFLREADEAVGYQPSREQPPALEGFGARGIVKAVRKAKQKNDYWDTLNQPSEKAMARQRRASKTVTSRVA